MRNMLGCAHCAYAPVGPLFDVHPPSTPGSITSVLCFPVASIEPTGLLA